VSPPTVLGANNYHYLRGGSERVFLELGRLLSARGHRVVHLSTAHPRNEPAPGPAAFVPPNDLERPGPLDLVRFHYSRRAERAAQGLLARERIQLAHLHIYYGQLTPAILAPLARAGVPIVQTLHEYKPLCPVHNLLSRGRPCEACAGRHFWRALPRRCNRGSLARTAVSVSEAYLARALGADSRVTRFVAVSEFLRAKVLEHGFAPERVVTVPNFIDASALRPASGPGEHVLFAGRLEGYKGVFTLLEAAAEARALPVLFAGDGPARAELERRAATLGLAHVRVLGFQDDAALAALVRASRCVVVPSLWHETFGLAALEALAQGRAVIASRIGALPELVQDGENGFLVPPGDAAALAGRLRWMAEHASEAAALGARGRVRALEVYSPEEHYARLAAVYREVA
jgi:glycosyltransferase involved in cell wall biosynthesis